jgi:signal transduction histidine kinase
VYHSVHRPTGHLEVHLLPSALRRFPALCALTAFLVALTLIATLFQTHYVFHQSIFVPLHTAMHVFSLVVAWLVFAIGWSTQDPQRRGSVTVLACGFLGVALIDFGHALSYAGMPDFVTPASAEKSINFSLVSRLLAAVALLAIAFVPSKPLPNALSRYVLLAATLGLVALVYWVILFHPDVLPATFVPGIGQTALKVGAEHLLVLLHVAAAIGFYRQLNDAQASNAAFLLAASVVMALSQALIALYSHPYDIHNFLSHVYRVVGYVLIYRGIFLSEMREPYRMAERLQNELRELSARMQQDIEQERKRISQALHDEMGQNLTALQLDASWIRRHCTDAPEVLAVVDRMQESISHSASSMRRIVADMRPRVLDDLGICAAINGLVEDVSARTGMAVEFVAAGPLDDMADAAKTALYRMLQECLTNVSRHAQANKVEIALVADGQRVEMTVADDGRGFATDAPRKRDSFGLFGLHERAAQLGGSVKLDSAPGAGTRITVLLSKAAV